jgi:hypothetical protein
MNPLNHFKCFNAKLKLLTFMTIVIDFKWIKCFNAKRIFAPSTLRPFDSAQGSSGIFGDILNRCLSNLSTRCLSNLSTRCLSEVEGGCRLGDSSLPFDSAQGTGTAQLQGTDDVQFQRTDIEQHQPMPEALEHTRCLSAVEGGGYFILWNTSGYKVLL